MANSIERTGKIFMGPANQKFDESLLLENASKRKKEEEAAAQAAELLIKAEQEKQKEIEAKLETLEMLSVGPKVIILPYVKNPYRKTVSKGGILIDYDGEFKNPDTGEEDKMQKGIMCAKVIEIGPEVKYLKPGDDIYYLANSALPIPFFNQGYQVIAEQNALTVLNQGLRARYNME